MITPKLVIHVVNYPLPVTPRRHRPMTPARKPGARVSVLTAMTPKECAAMLTRNLVGRIAFADRAHVDIVPISYVFIDGGLYARADAPMRTAISRNRWVAVEVAEVIDVHRWRSVGVRGACYPIPASAATGRDAAADRGVGPGRGPPGLVAAAPPG